MKRLAIAAAALALALAGCAEEYTPKPSYDRDLIVLGVDGMDPVLAQQYMDEGKLPNFKKLAERGGFMPLGTTDPPQSPVAWSTVITGLGLGGHGIYDFVHRDPIHLSPYLSTSRNYEESSFFGLFSEPKSELLRGGTAFWQILESGKVPAAVVKMPANFPPAPTEMNESTSDMGTPDLMGTYGTFQVYSSDPAWKDRHVSAGIVHFIDFGETQTGRSELAGPPGLSLPAEIVRDVERKVALVRLGDREVLLAEGDWSEWIPLSFPTGIFSDMSGIVRLHLRSVEPLHLYVSPINVDPLDPAMPISEPPAFAVEMAERIGRFYTQGLVEDTKALSGGVLSDDEFLEQAEIAFQERLRMFREEMKRFSGGLLFFYFGSVDQVGHMYYGSLMDDAPPEWKKYDHVVPETYVKMDAVLGELLEWAGDRPVVVMSDHGFAPYTWKVNLNTWLAQMGYLSLLPPDQVGEGPLGHIDWEKTQAYALGLNQLFINVEGREARGVVAEDDRELILRRLQRDLESWRHEGERVVTEAMRPEVGDYPDRAPDLIVGYNRGYRSSDGSAMGQVGGPVIERNTDHWNGDHCMHASHVPGVLFTSMPLAVEEGSLVDVAPSILAYFGVDRPEDMDGQILWKNSEE